jgi:hypothetical protein
MHKPLGTYMAGVAVVLVAAAFALPALAGNGGKGGGSGTTSSSISIASVDGAAAPASPTTKLGDTMKFNTTVQPLSGWQHPMVAVSCYQDVNNDGVIDTSITGPDVVYTQLDTPSVTYTLGGYASIWTNRGGGPALCRADLDAYGFHNGGESIQVLATTATWQS